MQKWVLRIEATAKRNAPTDQGQLKNMINSAVVEQGYEILGIVGDKAEHAPFQEYGTGQIGKRTALAQGVEAPSWYRYGPQSGHYVPFNKAPGLKRWLGKHGFSLEATGLGGYDIMLKGTGTILFRNAKGFKVSGRAQPFLTPAVMKYIDKIMRDFERLPEEVKE
jgi:hypothetical protein